MSQSHRVVAGEGTAAYSSRRNGLRASVVVRSLTALAALLAATGMAQAGEVQVSNSIIIDYEFDTVDSLLTFVDTNNNLWVANVDPATGAFVPSNGQGTLVDTGAAQAITFGNGPEWVQAADGFHIIYTKYTPGSIYSANTANVGYASQVKGKWKGGVLPHTVGFGEPIGNLSGTDAAPPVAFRNLTAAGFQLYLQDVTGQAVATKIPNTIQSSGSDRFVPGLSELIYTEPVVSGSNSYHQVFTYDYDAKTTTQLTTAPYNAGPVFMFQAPELNNDYSFFTVLNEQRIVFYREVTSRSGGPSTWTPVSQITNPPGAPPYIWSPEPFSYKGKTYIFYQRSTNPDPEDFSTPSQIWIASMDGTINKQISDPTVTNVFRSDPEFFITSSQGPQIYYNRYSLTTKGSPYQSLGVWRCDAGLGKP
jgi:hypothetical protein